MLQQNSEYRSNDPAVNAVHSHAECENNTRIFLLATLTSVLTRKSNGRLGGPHFLVKLLYFCSPFTEKGTP